MFETKDLNACLKYLFTSRNVMTMRSAKNTINGVFFNYSNINIKDVRLFESLKSPLFKQFNKRHPFNKNYLRRYPLLDSPDKLKEMVHELNAQSTQMIDRESVDDLTDKCQQAAKNRLSVADRIRRESNKLSNFVNKSHSRFWDKNWHDIEDLFEEPNKKTLKGGILMFDGFKTKTKNFVKSLKPSFKREKKHSVTKKEY